MEFPPPLHPYHRNLNQKNHETCMSMKSQMVMMIDFMQVPFDQLNN